jgi:hypothetical protein
MLTAPVGSCPSSQCYEVSVLASMFVVFEEEKKYSIYVGLKEE